MRETRGLKCVLVRKVQPEPVNLSTRSSSLPSSTHSIHPKLRKPSVYVVFVRSRVSVLVPRPGTDDRGEEMNLPGLVPRPPWTHTNYQERLRAETELQRLPLSLYFLNTSQVTPGAALQHTTGIR